MPNKLKIELLEAFENSGIEYQKSLVELAKRCAIASKKGRYSGPRPTALGAESQAISIKVLPSSVASR